MATRIRKTNIEVGLVLVPYFSSQLLHQFYIDTSHLNKVDASVFSTYPKLRCLDFL